MDKASKRIKKTDLFNALYTLNKAAGHEARLAMHAGYDFETASMMHCQGYYVLYSERTWSLWLGTDRIEDVLATYVCGSQGLREMLNTVKTITRHVKALKLAGIASKIDGLVEDTF